MPEPVPEASTALPGPVSDAINSVAKLQKDHDARASSVLRLVQKLTGRVGRPAFVPVVTALVVAWMLLNSGAAGFTPLDPPPFAGLACMTSIAALLMTGMILATQRHDNELSSRREQLTLELSLLSEQKAAKLIELMERLRQDHPDLENSNDRHARDLSASASLQDVLDASDQRHSSAQATAG